MNFLKTIRAEAHCDIPCGVYDPTPAKIAAKTIARMVSQIGELHPPEGFPLSLNLAAMKTMANAMTRRVVVKEEHAALCKKEVLILWADFFKPEHLEKHPGLHDIVWKAAKLCSKNKQDVDANAAQELVAAVDEIARIFYDVKGAPEKFEAYKKITDTLY